MARSSAGSVFEEFRRALTEQYVCQQLIASCGLTPHYWSAAKSTGDIDLPVEGEGSVFALEVKAKENLRAFKGAHPEARAVRFSLSGYREQDWMRNVPLYAISCKGLWA